jgi:hypothetical protein
MTEIAKVLSSVPKGLRDPLLEEYQSIVQNFLESRWTPSELSGGKFSEIVYSILDGFSKGAFLPTPTKPKSMVDACRKLESNSHVPRSFQILIPRLLPALYEVRNNRGVGHVGGDVNPNHMDAAFVVSSCNWILCELIRVFHSLSLDEAQAIVESLAERRVPLVWQSADMRLVLDPSLSLRDQILLLLSVANGRVSALDLQRWLKYKNKMYLLKLLRKMDAGRLVHISGNSKEIEILPPGSRLAADLAKQSLA